jgi:signal transduction histidine kinase
MLAGEVCVPTLTALDWSAARLVDTHSIAALIHGVGFLTAFALYALLLWMAAGPTRGSASDRRLPLVTALLGLVWNAGSLLAYGLPALGQQIASPAFLGLSYSALGFLPALVVDTALRRAAPGRAPALIRALAYALGGVAASLHLAQAFGAGRAPSDAALRLLAGGFAGLVVALVVVGAREAGRSASFVWAAAVLAFSGSAWHLAGHQSIEAWPSAVFGHHASLPLALAVFYQDYRFVLADVFLRRALALTLLAGLALGLYLGVAEPVLSAVGGHAHTDARVEGLILVLWIGTALAYPALQRAAGFLVDRAILGRADYAELRARIEASIARSTTVEDALDAACELLARALGASVRWSALDEGAPSAATGASVAIPTADAPRFVLHVEGLSGGRRLLSQDTSFLESVALVLSRRVDALRLADERYERDLREQRIRKLAAEAELRALRSQLNPHFLFNALNTIGYLLQRTPERALATLFDLTNLLRAVLKRSRGDFVTLGQELELVEAYLAIERARFEERLRVAIEVPVSLRSLPIPSLVVQPLVENAIKHGIAPKRTGGDVAVRAWLDESPSAGALLLIVVEDSGRGASDVAVSLGRQRGVGLSNIEQRLRAHYAERASLQVDSVPESGTTVRLSLPVAAELLREDRARLATVERPA